MAGSAALPASRSRLSLRLFLVLAILYPGGSVIFLLLFLGILPRGAELLAIVLYGLGLILLYRERRAVIR